MTFQLLDKLESYGINLVPDGGRVKLRLPWSPDRIPAEVMPLLQKLKQWNDGWAESAFVNVHLDLIGRYPSKYLREAFVWAEKYKPGISESFDRAEIAINQTCINKDMAGFLIALRQYEKAINGVLTEYGRSHQ